jgi:hypothetical protein
MNVTAGSGRRFVAGCAAVMTAAAVCVAGPRIADAATCDVIPGVTPANTPFGVLAISDDSNDRRWTVGAPYWVAVGAIAYNPADDFDVNVYGYNYNGFPPPCFTPLLGTSSRGAGQTDFVVGDFNSNPTGTFVNTVTCYSGQCDGQTRGLQGWRDGDIFFVNDPPHVLTFPTLIDRIVKIWDIYLVQGTTYHFRFQPSGDTQPMLLLFRNPTGGVYWTGRYGAEFETANCITNYTAPSTGYYGMVVVNDRYSTNPVAITLAVTTGAACACPGYLADGVPQSIAPGATQLDAGVADPYAYVWSVGVRSNSDWDLYGGESTPGPDQGCISTIRRSSTLIPPKADMLLANREFQYPFPDTFAVRASRFSGSDGATLEASQAFGIQANAPSRVGYMGADEVVRTWAALLERDTTYSVRFFPGGDIKLLVYPDLLDAPSDWQSRSDAWIETSVSTSFKADSSGLYIFAQVKDDGGIDNYDFGFGFCSAARPLTSKLPLDNFDGVYPGQFKPYFSFDQQAPHWAAACVYGSGGLDWDIAQYGQPSGNPWPECLGAAGALSNGVVGVDVIAGDFHYIPTGTYYLHSYRAGINDDFAGYTEWDAGSGTLQVNALLPAHGDMLGNDYSDRLWCYEAYLYGGLPYSIALTPSGAASPRALVFENPGTSAYWAPRSAAILSTGGTAPFIPATTGWHAIVVVNDNQSAGSFDLRLLSSVASAGLTPTPTRDELSAVAPNPARGPLRIDYALAHPANVSFEVLDLAGRLVLRIPASATGAGRWSQGWDGRGASGQPLAGGVYLLRMRVDGRTVATRKVMRLN